MFSLPSRQSAALVSRPFLPGSLLGLILITGGWHQVLLAGLSVATFLLATAPLEVQRRLVDEALLGGVFQLIVLLAACYGGLALLEGGVKLLTNLYRAWLAESVVRALRQRVHDRGPQMPGPGDADGIGLAMILSECEGIGGFVGSSVSEPLLQGGLLVSVLAYMAYLQPMMALLGLLVLAPQIILVPLAQRAINRRVSDRIVILRAFTVAAVTDPGDAGGTQAARISQVFELNMGIFTLKFSLNFLMNLLHHLSLAGIFGLGGWYLVQGRTDLGTVVAFASGLAKINDPWGDLVDWLRDLMVTRAKYRMLHSALT